jgi:hypothetical protein
MTFPSDKRIIEQARQNCDLEVQIDDDAEVDTDCCGGAWVTARIWVDIDDNGNFT